MSFTSNPEWLTFAALWYGTPVLIFLAFAAPSWLLSSWARFGAFMEAYSKKKHLAAAQLVKERAESQEALEQADSAKWEEEITQRAAWRLAHAEVSEWCGDENPYEPTEEEFLQEVSRSVQWDPEFVKALRKKMLADGRLRLVREANGKISIALRDRGERHG